MPIDFPNGPTVGQSFTYGGRTWIFNGFGWAAQGNSSNYVPPTATVSGRMNVEEATNNGTNKVVVAAPNSLPADVTVQLPATTGDILSNAESKNLSAGYTATAFPAGTKSSGTFTPDPANGNLQKVTNGGAHTLAAPSVGSGDSLSMVILYENNSSAGAVTLTGFTKTDGTFNTTSGNKFMCFITVIAGFSYVSVIALQ